MVNKHKKQSNINFHAEITNKAFTSNISASEEIFMIKPTMYFFIPEEK